MSVPSPSLHDAFALPTSPFDEVVPGLFQADNTFAPEQLFELGFEAVFDLGGWDRGSHLTDRSYVFYAIDDLPWITDPQAIRDLAVEVAALVRAGKQVVVNCMAGLNRSGLLVGRTLIELGHPPADAIALVRRARGPRALSN
ncbi:MAG: protein-tyrosine phosphatase family protein, partial [Actinomycetota bacterium]